MAPKTRAPLTQMPAPGSAAPANVEPFEYRAAPCIEQCHLVATATLIQVNWPVKFHALREHAGLVFQKQLDG